MSPVFWSTCCYSSSAHVMVQYTVLERAASHLLCDAWALKDVVSVLDTALQTNKLDTQKWGIGACCPLAAAVLWGLLLKCRVSSTLCQGCWRWWECKELCRAGAEQLQVSQCRRSGWVCVSPLHVQQNPSWWKSLHLHSAGKKKQQQKPQTWKLPAVPPGTHRTSWEKFIERRYPSGFNSHRARSHILLTWNHRIIWIGGNLQRPPSATPYRVHHLPSYSPLRFWQTCTWVSFPPALAVISRLQVGTSKMQPTSHLGIQEGKK